MPTVREYSEGEGLQRCKTASSHSRFNRTKRDQEILQLAEKIRINTINFKGKQVEGMGFTDKIKKLSKMMDFMAQDRAEKVRRKRKRISRSVAR